MSTDLTCTLGVQNEIERLRKLVKSHTNKITLLTAACNELEDKIFVLEQNLQSNETKYKVSLRELQSQKAMCDYLQNELDNKTENEKVLNKRYEEKIKNINLLKGEIVNLKEVNSSQRKLLENEDKNEKEKLKNICKLYRDRADELQKSLNEVRCDLFAKETDLLTLQYSQEQNIHIENRKLHRCASIESDLEFPLGKKSQDVNMSESFRELQHSVCEQLENKKSLLEEFEQLKGGIKQSSLSNSDNISESASGKDYDNFTRNNISPLKFSKENDEQFQKWLEMIRKNVNENHLAIESVMKDAPCVEDQPLTQSEEYDYAYIKIEALENALLQEKYNYSKLHKKCIRVQNQIEQMETEQNASREKEVECMAKCSEEMVKNKLLEKEIESVKLQNAIDRRNYRMKISAFESTIHKLELDIKIKNIETAFTLKKQSSTSDNAKENKVDVVTPKRYLKSGNFDYGNYVAYTSETANNFLYEQSKQHRKRLKVSTNMKDSQDNSCDNSFFVNAASGTTPTSINPKGKKYMKYLKTQYLRKSHPSHTLEVTSPFSVRRQQQLYPITEQNTPVTPIRATLKKFE